MTGLVFTGLIAMTGGLEAVVIQGMKSVNEAEVNKGISCKAKNQILMDEYKKCLKRQKEQAALDDTEVVNCEEPKLKECNAK